jgi:hypothetical protein
VGPGIPGPKRLRGGGGNCCCLRPTAASRRPCSFSRPFSTNDFDCGRPHSWRRRREQCLWCYSRRRRCCGFHLLGVGLCSPPSRLGALGSPRAGGLCGHQCALPLAWPETNQHIVSPPRKTPERETPRLGFDLCIDLHHHILAGFFLFRKLLFGLTPAPSQLVRGGPLTPSHFGLSLGPFPCPICRSDRRAPSPSPKREWGSAHFGLNL